MAKLVSLIIPAHNEEETIAEVLRAVVAQTYEPKEIIVVNDHSTDRTSEIVSRFPGVREIVNERNLGLARSMNVGLRAARGDILMVLHADCVPIGTDWMEKMVQPFADETVGAVVSQRVMEDRSKLSLAEKLFDSIAPQQFINETGRLTETAFFRDKCDAYRGSVVRELGFFDEEAFFVAGEDTDLSMKMRKAGYRIMLSGDAKIRSMFSSHQRSLKSVLLKKSLQYGSAAAQLYKRHGYDGLRTRAFLATLIAFLVFPLLFVSHALSTVIYGLLFLGTMTCWIEVRGRKLPIAAPMPVLFVLFVLLGMPHWWAASLSVLTVLGLHLLHMVLKSVRHVIRMGEPWKLVPAVFAFALCWRLLSGVGFLIGSIKMMTARRES